MKEIEPNCSKYKKIIDKNLINIFSKMKSTTYIVEITNQKNEKYLYVGRNPVAWLPPRLVSTKKFSVCVN